MAKTSCRLALFATLVQEAHRAVQEENRGIPILAAKTLRDMGRRDESYEQLERTIALNPKHADGYTLRGQFLLFDQLEQLVQRTTPMRNEDKRLVIDSFQRAFELNPYDFHAADGLALVYRTSGAAAEQLAEQWEKRRDGAMAKISISQECATTGNLLFTRSATSPPPRKAPPF